MKKILHIIILATIMLVMNSYPLSAQELNISKVAGNTPSSSISASLRLQGAKRVILFVPSSRDQINDYIFQCFEGYLRSLGLEVKVIPHTYKKRTQQIDMLTGHYTEPYLPDMFDYFDSVNDVVFGISTVWSSGGYYTGPDPSGVITMADFDNQWQFRMDFPSKYEKFVKKCKQSICSSYSYNSRYSYKPEYYTSNVTENWVKNNINSSLDGIYESGDYTLGFVSSKDNNKHYLIFLNSPKGFKDWNVGDVKAELFETSTPGVYTANWYGRWKQKMRYRIIFQQGLMTTYDEDNESDPYIKTFPTASDISNSVSEPDSWGGSAFALKDGYLVTNYHVVENANSIKVIGIKGDFNIEYNASVIASDKTNDLALLKISDSRFTGFGVIPYSIKTSTAQVGEDIFVLGYPLTSTMGDEIKLTTGVISSKTGFQGDITLYQISAPIQPGNSGGPLFDSKGNVIGIVSAKHTGAENVGYAIKAAYLSNLVESMVSSSILPNHNTISSLSLPNKIQKIDKFVYMVKCSSASNLSSNVKDINRLLIHGDGAELLLNSVECNPNQTILNFTGRNFVWCNIDSNSHIVVNGKKYYLTEAIGIPISPNRVEGRYIKFSLKFPSIPTNANSLDFIENETSKWKFFNVNL